MTAARSINAGCAVGSQLHRQLAVAVVANDGASILKIRVATAAHDAIVASKALILLVIVALGASSLAPLLLTLVSGAKAQGSELLSAFLAGFEKRYSRAIR